MLLHLADGSSFATGQARYVRRSIGSTNTNVRIFTAVELEGVTFEAMLDTGAPWLVCSPDVGAVVAASRSRLQQTSLVIRGVRRRGSLCRVPIVLPADEGEDLALEVTAFLAEGQDGWGGFPDLVLGWFCCLERIRFAVSPGHTGQDEDSFYFGPID